MIKQKAFQQIQKQKANALPVALVIYNLHFKPAQIVDLCISEQPQMPFTEHIIAVNKVNGCNFAAQRIIFAAIAAISVKAFAIAHADKLHKSHVECIAPEIKQWHYFELPPIDAISFNAAVGHFNQLTFSSNDACVGKSGSHALTKVSYAIGYYVTTSVRFRFQCKRPKDQCDYYP